MSTRPSQAEVFGGNEETGILMSEEDWLRLHFQACLDAHRQQVEQVPWTPAGTVLDAGCGPGHYLPLIAAGVGDNGTIHGCDRATTLLSSAQRDYGEGRAGCRVVLEEGDLFDLPYDDATFDTVWCANVAQYVTDDELTRIVAELTRVAKPGGHVVVKDWDFSLWRFQPAPPPFIWHLAEAWAGAFTASDDDPPDPLLLQGYGCMRTPRLSRWLREAGLKHIVQTSTLAYHRAPLSNDKRAWCVRMLQMFAELSAKFGVDEAFWSRFNEPDAPGCLLNDPEFFMTEGSTLALGVKD